MIALAARHSDSGDLHYYVADLTKTLPMAGASFHFVVANMVLMDLPRIDVPIMEFARMLLPGGRFVFSLTHPCFFSSDWVHDTTGHRQHKAVRDYLTPTVEKVEFWALPCTFIGRCRSISMS